PVRMRVAVWLSRAKAMLATGDQVPDTAWATGTRTRRKASARLTLSPARAGDPGRGVHPARHPTAIPRWMVPTKCLVGSPKADLDGIAISLRWACEPAGPLMC